MASVIKVVPSIVPRFSQRAVMRSPATNDGRSKRETEFRHRHMQLSSHTFLAFDRP